MLPASVDYPAGTRISFGTEEGVVTYASVFSDMIDVRWDKNPDVITSFRGSLVSVISRPKKKKITLDDLPVGATFVDTGDGEKIRKFADGWRYKFPGGSWVNQNTRYLIEALVPERWGYYVKQSKKSLMKPLTEMEWEL